MRRHVPFLRGRSAMVRHDQLTLLQEFVRDADAFAEQPTRILPQIEYQALEIAHLFQRFGHFMLGGFLESGDVHVSDTRLDHEVQVHAVTRNLVADDRKFQGMIGTLAQHGDADGSALWSLEQVGNIGGAHVVGGLAVNAGNDVSGTNTGTVGGGTNKWSNNDNLIIARPHRHAHAVILAALFFAQGGVRLGIEKIGVRIELVQHARDGAVVDRLVSVYRVGIILLDLFIHLGKLLQAVADVGVTTRRGGWADSLRE